MTNRVISVRKLGHLYQSLVRHIPTKREFYGYGLTRKAATADAHRRIMRTTKIRRRYFKEGTEMDGYIIENTGWYVFLDGAWRWDENSQVAT